MSLPPKTSLTADIPSTVFHEKEKSRKHDDAPSPATTIVVESVSIAKTRSPTVRFDSLPSDVIARIIHHALEHSQRGVPYYPPINAPCLLPLALTNQHIRTLIASKCDSDLSYVDAVHSVCEYNEKHVVAKRELVQFYRAQNGHLKKFNLHKMTTISHYFRLELTEIVLSTKPRLTEIDVSGMPRNGEYCAQMLQKVVDVIQLSSSSLQNLKISFHNANFVDMVNSLSLPNLTNVNVRITYGTLPKRVTRFFSKHGASLHTLTLFSAVDIADDIATQIVAHCPGIKHLRFNGGMDPEISSSFLTLIRSYSELQSVSLHNYELHEGLCSTLETHPNKPKLYICRSMFYNLPRLVLDVPSFSKTLVKAETVMGDTDEIMTALTHLQNLEELHIQVHPTMVLRFRTVLSLLKNLKSLTIKCCSVGQNAVPRAVIDEDVVVALEGAKCLRQLVIAEPALSVTSLQRIMKCHGDRLEYFVAGIHSPGRSQMRSIIDMVKWVMRHNANMKVLCFGLALRYDSNAKELYDELMRTIALAEQKLPKLNTYWLRLNAKTLLTFPSPAEQGTVHHHDDDGEDDARDD